jgi:hypothetical protein
MFKTLKRKIFLTRSKDISPSKILEILLFTLLFILIINFTTQTQKLSKLRQEHSFLNEKFQKVNNNYIDLYSEYRKTINK